MKSARLLTTDDDGLLQQLCEMVASLEGVDPVGLPPLYDAVDVEALSALLDPRTSEVSVSFEYLSYWITVTPSELEIREAVERRN